MPSPRRRRPLRAPRSLLSVEKVDTFYGKSHIINGVSLEVAEHEIVALLGRNGAGKSTLLKTLIGIAPPETGSISSPAPRSRGTAPPRSRGAASVMCRRAGACSPA